MVNVVPARHSFFEDGTYLCDHLRWAVSRKVAHSLCWTLVLRSLPILEKVFKGILSRLSSISSEITSGTSGVWPNDDISLVRALSWAFTQHKWSLTQNLNQHNTSPGVSLSLPQCFDGRILWQVSALVWMPKFKCRVRSTFECRILCQHFIHVFHFKNIECRASTTFTVKCRMFS